MKLSTSAVKVKAPEATRERIFVEILRDLEAQRMVPGQRIVEADLIERFGVGRNAVREGIQLLSERGVVDLSPNKSAVIRRFTLKEAQGVMDLCATLNGLLASTAAREFRPEDAAMFDKALAEAEAALGHGEQACARARRHFSAALLHICRNKELQRIFPMAGIAIFSAQFRSDEINRVQAEAYRHIHAAVSAGNSAAAEKAARSLVEKLRKVIVATMF